MKDYTAYLARKLVPITISADRLATLPQFLCAGSDFSCNGLPWLFSVHFCGFFLWSFRFSKSARLFYT